LTSPQGERIQVSIDKSIDAKGKTVGESFGRKAPGKYQGSV
jgi:hypothetical protein